MKIGPANNSTPLIKEKQEATNKANQGVQKENTREDQLSISNQAKELQTKYKTSIKVTAENENNSKNKLNLIKLKIKEGYYDNPQTKIMIAEKISDNKEILREYYKNIF
ncbi:MAG: hypothetical protein GY865_17160 [candidate division Zixibacteria bacterium]|nr:hypothetical protein [candidate division Zixibacteria bacterium]